MDCSVLTLYSRLSHLAPPLSSLILLFVPYSAQRFQGALFSLMCGHQLTLVCEAEQTVHNYQRRVRIDARDASILFENRVNAVLRIRQRPVNNHLRLEAYHHHAVRNEWFALERCGVIADRLLPLLHHRLQPSGAPSFWWSISARCADA